MEKKSEQNFAEQFYLSRILLKSKHFIFYAVLCNV